MHASKNSHYRVVVLLSGRGTSLDSLSASILAEQWPIEIALVVSDREAAPGLAIAKAWNIPALAIPRRAKERSCEEFHRELISAVEGANPDLVVLAGYMRVLADEFIKAFFGKIINIHPSLLPAFKGLHAQQQAIDAGAKFAGCTVHAVVPELDSGPMLAQAVVPVLPGDTAELLAKRILVQEHQLYPSVVGALGTGKMKIEILEDSTLRVHGGESCCSDGDALLSLRR